MQNALVLFINNYDIYVILTIISKGNIFLTLFFVYQKFIQNKNKFIIFSLIY